MSKIICGIQQMGIGVPDVQEIWKWYRKFFGMDIKVFEDAAEAPLMIDYTGGKVQNRTASLAISMEGGGGFEIWQYKSRGTEKAKFEIELGDYGLYICKIKSKNPEKSYQFFKENDAPFLSDLLERPDGTKHFYCKDPNDNIFEIVQGDGFFKETNHPSYCGGVAGTVIGVSDIEKSLKLYQDILQYDSVVYDKSEIFDDLKALPNGKSKFRRVLLKHSKLRKGPFAELLGPTEIELVQDLDNSSRKKIFQDRFWGDWGFIHLCFDVQGIEELKIECENKGFPFTVDSSQTFDMGEAGGRFSYIEDPDGTLIELVETHKVPIVKKLGWYINLKNRNPEKHLPQWMLKAMGLNRVK